MPSGAGRGGSAATSRGVPPVLSFGRASTVGRAAIARTMISVVIHRSTRDMSHSLLSRRGGAAGTPVSALGGRDPCEFSQSIGGRSNCLCLVLVQYVRYRWG